MPSTSQTLAPDASSIVRLKRGTIAELVGREQVALMAAGRASSSVAVGI